MTLEAKRGDGARPGEWSGGVRGEGVRGAAVELAGFLAESGVLELWLTEDGVRTRLTARQTDLPGVLERAGGGAVVEGVVGESAGRTARVRFEVGADGVRWVVSGDDGAGERLAENLRARWGI